MYVNRAYKDIKGKIIKGTSILMLSSMLFTGMAKTYNIWQQIKNTNPYASPAIIYKENHKRAFEVKKLEIKDILEYAGKTSALGKYVEAVAYAESKFNQQAVSYAQAYGVMQVKKIAYDEVQRIYNIAKKYGKKWEKHLPYERWEDPGNRKHYETLNVEGDIKYVYLPFYFTWKAFFGNRIPSWEEVKRNAVVNIFIGTLYLLYLELEYGRYQAIKTQNGIKYVKRKPSFFEGRGYLRAIPPEFIWMLYNQGPIVLKKLKEILQEGEYLWEYLEKGPEQTRKGIKKILAYLEERG